jgi:hypothetical protein
VAVAQAMCVIKAERAIGSGQVHTHARSHVQLKGPSASGIEPVTGMGRISKHGDAYARQFWPLEPALQLERRGLRLTSKYGPVDHAVVQQWMGAQKTGPRSTLARAGPDRERRLCAHKIGADLAENGEPRRLHC